MGQNPLEKENLALRQDFAHKNKGIAIYPGVFIISNLAGISVPA